MNVSTEFDKPKIGSFEVGKLYYWHPHYATRDFPIVVLLLRLYTNWHSEDIGMFLDIEKLEEVNLELFQKNDHLVEIETG